MTPRLLANFCEFLMEPKGKHSLIGQLSVIEKDCFTANATQRGLQ